MTPIVALQRWIVQTRAKPKRPDPIRRVETLFESVRRPDRKPLRGILLAPDLCLTRQRTFFRINGPRAEPLTNEQVAAQYSLTELQAAYRSIQETWKSQRRRLAS